MKKIRFLLVLIISFFISMTNCYAQTINVDNSCSITGKYSYGDVNITDTEVYLYKIASVNSVAQYSYLLEFTNLSMNINELKDTDWVKFSKYVSDYINDNNIDSIGKLKTDDTGGFVFEGLDTGLYLIVVDSKKTDDYEYFSNPMLVSLPNYDEVSLEFIYDLGVVVKTEAKSLNVTPGTSTEVPNTYDSLYLHIILLSISLIIFIVTFIYLRKIKKEEKYEKKH